MDGNISDILKQAIEQINHLQKLPYRNTEYQPWLDKTAAMLKEQFGENSAQVRRFVNAPGKAFVIGTDTGRMQEYQRQLEAYEEALRELAGK